MKQLIAQAGGSVPFTPEKERRPETPSEYHRRQAKRLFEEGRGYKFVAAALGLSKYTVRDWLRAYKRGTFRVSASANQFRYSPEAKRYVADLRLAGLSWRQISAKTGVSPSTCRNWVKELGLEELDGERDSALIAHDDSSFDDSKFGS